MRGNSPTCWRIRDLSVFDPKIGQTERGRLVLGPPKELIMKVRELGAPPRIVLAKPRDNFFTGAGNSAYHFSIKLRC